jgi:hypothetical protein
MIDRVPKLHFGLSSRFAMTISDLPAVNATLNATSTVFIS